MFDLPVGTNRQMRQARKLREFLLDAVRQEKAYELWLVNDQQAKIPAGTFHVDGSGQVSITTSVPMPGGLLLVAVTDEPAAGVPQPTGNFQLLGKVKPD